MMRDGGFAATTPEVLRKEMQKDAAMRAMLLRYAMATLTAVAQSAACNRLHMLEQRCARWLCPRHDGRL
jgi:hypothetical protein